MHTINIRYTHTHNKKFIIKSDTYLQFTNTYSYFRVKNTCTKGA